MTKETTQLLETLIGKIEEEAISLIKQSGFQPRITCRDKVQFMCTMDLRFDRINLVIDNNLVIKTSLG